MWIDMRTLLMAFCLILIPALRGIPQEMLELEDAIGIGLQQNYGIMIARNDARIASNNAAPGNAGMLPVLDASGTYTLGVSNARVNTISGQELDNTAARSDLATAGINLRWRLFDGMKMFITYEKLKVLEERGALAARMEIEYTVAAIIVAYYNIIRQELRERILKEQVDISRYRLDLARLRYETGSGSELEWLKAKVELNADRAELANQRTESGNSRSYLNELLGRDINTPFIVGDTIRLLDSLRLDSLRQWMNTGNIRLQITRRSVDESALDLKSARAEQIPFIDFMAGYNYYRNETGASFLSYNRYFGPSVGISAGIKIFDGLNLHRQVMNTKISLKNSEFELNRLILRLDAFLFRIYNDYLNQLELVGFEAENLLLAEQNMELARESYAVGAISSLNLREIQKNLLDARQRYLNAKFLTKVKETELLLAAGKLVY